jgi:anti-anti-sigma factor
VPPRPIHTPTAAPGSKPGEWFFCLRHPAENGSVRIAMVGELDLAAAAGAARVIRRAQGDAAEIICDLGDLSFIDVCGLHVLLDASAYARRTGARLSFAHLPACIDRPLELLGLGAALEMGRCRPQRPPPLGTAGCGPGRRRARVRLVPPRRRR